MPKTIRPAIESIVGEKVVWSAAIANVMVPNDDSSAMMGHRNASRSRN